MKLQDVVNFFTVGIWRIRPSSLPRIKSFLVKHLQVFILALRGFSEDKCQLRASALTFYSLLSIVPVFAMAFGVAKGFGFEKLLREQILAGLSLQEEVLSRIISFSHSLLENTKGGMIAGVGVVILFWSVIKVLGNIEKSFNDIWGVKVQRTIGRRLSDYLSIMLICPILLVLSGSLTVSLSSGIELIVTRMSFLSFPLLFMLKLVPYLMIWSLFAFIYIFMPNTKVNFIPGILAAIVAGTAYQLAQWAYVNFQIGVSKYNAVYGSFAALPLFLVWVQLSWRILLLGAELSFARQNVETYEFEPDSLRISPYFKKLLSLRIMHLLVMNFSRRRGPLTDKAVSHELEIPIRLVREIIYELSGCGLVSETMAGRYKQPAYQPGQDVHDITIGYVISSLDRNGIDSIPVKQGPEFEFFRNSMRDFVKLVEKSPCNRRLKDI